MWPQILQALQWVDVSLCYDLIDCCRWNYGCWYGCCLCFYDWCWCCLPLPPKLFLTQFFTLLKGPLPEELAPPTEADWLLTNIGDLPLPLVCCCSAKKSPRSASMDVAAAMVLSTVSQQ